MHVTEKSVNRHAGMGGDTYQRYIREQQNNNKLCQNYPRHPQSDG